MPKRNFLIFVAARSRKVAKSGTKPVYQNRTETVKYVDTANTSHINALRKFCQIAQLLGEGARYHAIQARPTWIPGKIAAQITAKSVIASAERLIDVRHFCRSRNRMAEISVPACPIPIQKTKFVIPQAQPTGMLFPHVPTPVEIRYPIQKSPNVAALAVMVNATHHQRGAGCSTTPEMRSVSQLKLRRFKTNGTCAIRCSASLIFSGAAAGAPSITKLPIASCQRRQSKIKNRESEIHYSGNFSTKLATPMFSASGIFGFGLRMRAR